MSLNSQSRVRGCFFPPVSGDKGKSTNPTLALEPHRLRVTPSRLLTLNTSCPSWECSLNSSQLTGYSLGQFSSCQEPSQASCLVGRWSSWRTKLETAPTLQAPGSNSSRFYSSCTVKHSKTWWRDFLVRMITTELLTYLHRNFPAR